MPSCKNIGKYIKKVTPVLGWGSMLVGLASLTWWCTMTDPGMGAVASLVSPFPMSYIYNKIIFFLSKHYRYRGLEKGKA